MPTLHNLQHAFLNNVRNPDEQKILDHIESKGLTPAQRMQIYQNNFRLNLTDALRNHLPGGQQTRGRPILQLRCPRIHRRTLTDQRRPKRLR